MGRSSAVGTSQIDCLSLPPGGTPPLRVEPRENAEGTDFDRTGRHDLHTPKAVVVRGRNIYRPYDARSGDEACPTLFGANAPKIVRALGVLCRLLDGHDRNELVPRTDVAFAARVPIDVIALV
jgi:hypothetical protein